MSLQVKNADEAAKIVWATSQLPVIMILPSRTVAMDRSHRIFSHFVNELGLKGEEITDFAEKCGYNVDPTPA